LSGLPHVVIHPVSCFSLSAGHPRALHSFPTRRSSDLGMTKSTDFSVFEMMPVFGSAAILSWATVMCTPLEASTLRPASAFKGVRSEEHTSELQSRFDIVCRLLLAKKKAKTRAL